MGPSAILNGHHHVAWVDAIFQTYKKRAHSPRTSKKHKRKDKTTLELYFVIVREYWTLFESVWSMRNCILHSKDSIGAKMRHAHLNEQLLHFKCNGDSMLHCGDRNQINQPKAEILSWRRARKSKLLCMTSSQMTYEVPCGDIACWRLRVRSHFSSLASRQIGQLDQIGIWATHPRVMASHKQV